MKKSMWMVRASEGGTLADEFVERKVVAIGWSELGDLTQYKDKTALIAAYKRVWPGAPEGRAMNSASQLLRFRDELAIDDRVLTYDSSSRIYHLGTIIGGYRYAENVISRYFNIRDVRWDNDVERDQLSVATRNILGATLTLFRVPESAADEIERVQEGVVSSTSSPPLQEEVAEEENLLESYRTQSIEIIKDRVNRLGWEEMQELVAGLLRAMGYQTRVSTAGPDRGVDIMASPDGFGFESPRIIVEVKHRDSSIGADQIRSFLGGRHKDDKGLYVSTGGFSREARYEADRAGIPLMLLDIDSLVSSLLQHYDKMDMDTQKLLPLKKIYWPT
jgi:restriction system protein